MTGKELYEKYKGRTVKGDSYECIVCGYNDGICDPNDAGLIAAMITGDKGWQPEPEEGDIIITHNNNALGYCFVNEEDICENEAGICEVNGLNGLAKQIYQNNVEKGFWDRERNIGEMLMLITSELSEALEADRKNRHAYLPDFEEQVDKEGFDHTFKERVKDTFEDEMADALIRILDMCGGLGIDIEKHVTLNLEYNKTRPVRHGKDY